MKIDGLVFIREGRKHHVALFKDVADEFCRVEPRSRARIERHMEFLADEGPTRLNKEAFRFEDRFTVGVKSGAKVAIYAFKAGQVRIYGGIVSVSGKSTFVGSEIDIKKQDGADQALLRRAAQKLARFFS